jgi:raffinose/stachyose/melibiose transport system permease protein
VIQNYRKLEKVKNTLLLIVLIIVAVLFIAPVIVVFLNSFKTNTGMGVSFFSIPKGEFFAGIDNYVVGLTFGNYPFIKAFLNSVIVTITSTVLILICTSMSSWYIARVGSKFMKLIYNLCIFSMIVPFQMVMYTLSKTADMFNFNTPFSISIIYLGFGAGLAIFMFTGFIKSIPIEIEEAAAIDGCNPLQTFFKIVLPICKPMFISVAILEIMWIWNDYLLPYLVLDRTKYMTIPVHIQYLQGSYGQVDLGATMAIITMCLIPIVIIYIVWQKHIVKGMIDGAVK